MWLVVCIVDIFCNEMNIDIFFEEINKVGKELGIILIIIWDEELKMRGFGGIYGVGKVVLYFFVLVVFSYILDGVM